MKKLTFLGDSLSRLREFPPSAQSIAGFQLDRLQRGIAPDDWKPLTSVGVGVREVRVRELSGIFRIIYIVSLPEAVYVLHAFRKTTQKTDNRDLALAAARLRNLTRG